MYTMYVLAGGMVSRYQVIGDGTSGNVRNVPVQAHSFAHPGRLHHSEALEYNFTGPTLQKNELGYCAFKTITQVRNSSRAC